MIIIRSVLKTMKMVAVASTVEKMSKSPNVDE